MTEWRAVPGTDGWYEVNDRGEVWSHHAGRLLKVAVNDYGYRKFRIRGRTRGAHQLVLEAFVCPPPFDGAETRHLDGDPSHNWPGNLAWGTRTENAADKRRHGTHNRARQLACLRRGHALVGANLESWAVEHLGARKCLSCQRGYGDMIYYQSRGIDYDRDVLADQYFAWFMEGAPRPRSTPMLRQAALLESDQVAWRPAARPRRSGDFTPSTMSAILAAYGPGERFGVPAAQAAVSAAGVAVSRAAVYLALSRAVHLGALERLAPGSYLRLAEDVSIPTQRGVAVAPSEASASH